MARLILALICLCLTLKLPLLTVDGQVLHEGGKLALPVPEWCDNRLRHAKFNGSWYYVSWLNHARPSLAKSGLDESDDSEDRGVTWFQARNICRRHCMDSVSIESVAENDFVRSLVRKGGRRHVWTSGRKCNFAGCNRKDLQPAIVNGWYWAASGVRLPPTNLSFASLNEPGGRLWSESAADGVNRQPDNRELLITGRNDEACLAVMNNYYGDGIAWHDVACHRLKDFICEDSQPLIAYAAQQLRIKAAIRQQ